MILLLFARVYWHANFSCPLKNVFSLGGAAQLRAAPVARAPTAGRGVPRRPGLPRRRGPGPRRPPLPPPRLRLETARGAQRIRGRGWKLETDMSCVFLQRIPEHFP